MTQRSAKTSEEIRKLADLWGDELPDGAPFKNYRKSAKQGFVEGYAAATERKACAWPTISEQKQYLSATDNRSFEFRDGFYHACDWLRTRLEVGG
jgi:hypothetical protein